MTDPLRGDTSAEASIPNGAALIRRLRALIGGRGMGASMTRGTAASLFMQVAGGGLSFLGQILLSRTMGRANFGVYVTALAAMNMAQVIGKLELDSAATRFLAAYVGTGRWPLAIGFVQWSRRTLGRASTLVSLFGAAIVWLLWDRLVAEHPSMPWALLAACLLLPISARLVLNGAYLQALQRFGEAQLAGTVIRPGMLCLTLAALYWGIGVTPTAAQGVLANAATAALSLGLTMVLLARRWPAPMEGGVASFDQPEWHRAMRGLLLVGVSQSVVSQTLDLLVVGTILSTADSAHYGAASQVASLLNFGQASVSFVAAPMIAEFYARRQTSGLQRMIRLAMSVGAVITLPILAVLVAFGHAILGLYGPGYDDAYWILVILSVSASWVSIVGSLAGFLLTMTDYQREAGRIIGASAAGNLALTLVLTPKYGMLGTAVATLVATVGRSVALAIFIRRRMGLRLP